MKKKYFVSCITPTKQLGAMQFECEESELQEKSGDLCPEPAKFRAYEMKEFDNFPLNTFIPASKLKELGY